MINDMFNAIMGFYALIALSLIVVSVIAEQGEETFDPEYDRIHAEANENPMVLVDALRMKD